MTEETPAKIVGPFEAMGYAIGGALWEAHKSGVLTHEEQTAIANRADEIYQWLATGKVIEQQGNRYVVIGDAPGADGVLEIGG